MNTITKILSRFRHLFQLETLINHQTRTLAFNQKALLMQQYILFCNEKGVTDRKYTDHDIIVSLTSHGKRINAVALTIESIMQQTWKANRIILWLDGKFTHDDLPDALLRQEKRGLEIRFCKDIRSYTKLIPSLKLCPDSAIITIDDDLLYEYDILEKLIRAYQQDSAYIYCNRHHRMVLGSDGKPVAYQQWKQESNNQEADVCNFPTGVGGVLYPPHSLDPEVMNEDVFLDICPYADDIWFKAMALKNGFLSKRVFTHSPQGTDYLCNDAVQDIGLFHKNTEGSSLNDKQLHAVFSRYDLFKRLKA